MDQFASEWGTAVNVQSMVWKLGNDCATGVVFTKPSDGSNDIYEYLINAQGEDVVAGTRTPQYITKKQKRIKSKRGINGEGSMPKCILN